MSDKFSEHEINNMNKTKKSIVKFGRPISFTHLDARSKSVLGYTNLANLSSGFFSKMLTFVFVFVGECRFHATPSVNKSFEIIKVLTKCLPYFVAPK